MKKSTRNQLFVIITSILFLSSMASIAFFRTPVTKEPTYVSYPPVYGPIKKQFLRENVFDEPVEESVMLNMMYPHPRNTLPNIPLERKIGGAWILYSCNETCKNTISDFKDLVKIYYPRVYLAPYYKMNSTFAVVVWGNIMEFEKFNRTEVEDFICRSLIDPPNICALRSLEGISQSSEP